MVIACIDSSRQLRCQDATPVAPSTGLTTVGGQSQAHDGQRPRSRRSPWNATAPSPQRVTGPIMTSGSAGARLDPSTW